MNSRSVAFIRQLLATMAASLSPVTLGLLYGYTSQALPSLQAKDSTLSLQPHHISWISSVPPLVAVVATPLAVFLSSLLGRRRAMMVTALPMAAGWILTASAASVTTLIVGRGLCGAMTAISVPCAYTYVAEISSSDHRGFFASFLSIGFNFGLLMSYFAGAFLSWDKLALVSGIFPIVQFLVLSQATFSPRWLMSKGREEDATTTLTHLRGGESKEAEAELREYNRNGKLDSQGTFSFKLETLLSPGGRKAVAMCLGLMLFVQFTGFSVVNFHAKTILTTAHITMDANFATVMVGLVQLVGNIVSALLVDKVGRKHLLSVSGVMLVISQFLLATYFHFYHSDLMASARWTPVLFLVMFVFFFPLGWGSIPYILITELVPTAIRSETVVLCNMWEQLLQFVVLQVHSTFCRNGPQYLHWAFSSCIVFSFLFVYFLPNTTRKSLEDIQTFFTLLRSQAIDFISEKDDRCRKVSVYDIVGGADSRKNSMEKKHSVERGDKVVAIIDGDCMEAHQGGKQVRFAKVVEQLEQGKQGRS